MNWSATAKQLISEFCAPTVKLGDIKKRAKEIKKDHALALELWAHGNFHLRLLATVIFDKKLMDQNVIDQLVADMAKHQEEQRNQLTDWFLANQLMKDKKLIALMQTWQQHPTPLLRRLFWYHQARLRWTGQVPPDNSAELLDAIDKDLLDAEPEVQWAMNFCAGQIGVHQARYRDRCIRIGKDTGLYKDQMVAKNCTPSYLPEFIRIEVAKRE